MTRISRVHLVQILPNSRQFNSLDCGVALYISMHSEFCVPNERVSISIEDRSQLSLELQLRNSAFPLQSLTHIYQSLELNIFQWEL